VRSNLIRNAATKQTQLTGAARWLAGLILLAAIANAHAVPSFARQTDLECTVCHLSWPELTPTGRKFKLNGYTLGDRQTWPVAAMLQATRTSTASVDATASDQFPDDKKVVLQQASVFIAGKITDHAGVFAQWTYDGVENHAGVDNVDLRYANKIGEEDKELLYGFTLHNNPTVQDVYNTVPAWGFPFASSSVAVAPNASTMVDGALAQQVAGLGAYFQWKKTLYGELSTYRAANQGFSQLSAGQDRSQLASVKGYNPYWRLALEHQWNDGSQSAMIGTYGLRLDKFPDPANPSGPFDRFTDTAFDTQYQYITDRHRFSAQANWIHEKQEWNASFPLGAADNPSSTLDSFRGKLTYYFDRKYGVTLSPFSTKGDVNNAAFNTGDPITGSARGGPNTSGYILELNYLPLRNIRLAAQYTGYTRFNGAKDNYDGFGRNARDNNTLYLVAWFMF
jgi:hypothetical protein